MGRKPRVLIEGGIYHLYNRVSHGEHVFGDDAEVGRFVARLAEIKRRDGFQILAWCVMSNHYHLAVRMGEVALSRSMWSLHQRYTKSYNGRHHVFGPLWQGRYRSKLVEDTRHLQQLIVYIHLNPVAAGLVNDAADYPWSGHGELLRTVGGRGLVDVDEALGAFEPERRAALAHYRESTASEGAEDWMGEGPGRLPWWRVRRPLAREIDVLELDRQRPLIGMDGRSTVAARPRVDLVGFLRCGVSHLGVSLEGLRSSRRSPALMNARMVLASLAVELYRFRVTDVAAALDKYVDTVSLFVNRAARRRIHDTGFASLLHAVDEAIIDELRNSMSD